LEARFLLALLIAFLLTLIAAPPVIKLLARLKAGQSILHYVDNHLKKQGTATMGGVIFIVTGAAAAVFVIRKESTLALVMLAVTLAYGILGFLDDFIKVRFKRNLGLRAYQKIIGQVAIAVTIGIFAYTNGYIGSKIFLPFVQVEIDLSWGIIPFVVFIYLAVTNTVNLTDGLDGLAAGCTLFYLLSFGAIIILTASRLYALGEPEAYINELSNVAVTCGAFSGALISFLVFNAPPAKVFMGDTGALALGGVAASAAVFTGLELLIPIIGIMYVLSGISVIIQVLYFKRTRKRVFLMAPLHHHFECKGVAESKISAVYSIITAVMGIACLMLYFIFF